MNIFRSNSTHSTCNYSKQQTATHNFIVDSNTMNAQHPNVGINAMSLVKKCFSSSKHCLFVLLFVLSNLLFFQPTQAQTFDHYSGYTCDDTTGCRAWANDSLVLYLPPPNQDCHYKYFFKWRDIDCKQYDTVICGGIPVLTRRYNSLEIQPVAILLDFVNSDCGAGVKAFYGDTNNIHRIESLMRLADKTAAFNHAKSMSSCPPYTEAEQDQFKGYFVYDTISLSPLVIDSTLTSDTALTMIFTRPACRGICISYFRADSNSTIDSVYAKWHNCGTACCEVISTFCNIEDLPNVPSEYLNDGISARINVEVNYTGSCDTTPSVACPNSSTNKKVTKFKSCFDYCQDENGLDPFGLSFNENKKGVVNIDEMPYFSDKFIKSLSNDVLLESRTNEVIVKVTEEILSVKIVSINGVELLKMRNKIGNDILPISLHSLQNGLYLLVIESKDGVTTKPIIISK
jgi:hypothetical protein